MSIDSFPRPKNTSAASSGEQKVQEYADRINAGESVESIMQGLPPVFRTALEAKLASKTTETEKGEKGSETLDPKSYAEFKVKHGSTGSDEFWWYEYRNEAAKTLKNEGKFEWGKERIYFDAPVSEFTSLRDLMMEVAAREQIPIAFKYRDSVKTQIIGEDVDTRFVANFASTEDSAKFYRALLKDERYAKMIPDRHVDYKGLRLDQTAEFSSGLREERGSLERILSNGQELENGMFRYTSVSGKDAMLSQTEYKNFRNRYEEIKKKQQEAEALFAPKT